jgi:phosphatidylserine/phosphatidylglycerophosphate/cardiolipin synthase-like enzyme
MWPAWLKADFTAVQVALARTIAGETYEIAQMTTRALALARQRIYIENQYLTCRWVVDSLQRRLQQPDGPEVILILSRRYKGHLEKRVFGRLMEQAIRRLRHADHFHRLGVFYLAAGGSDESVLTKVHSKVMIVDDRFLKIGSANLSHRSMTVDTECDLGIEALDQSTTQAAIQNILTRLVAEHCDLSTTAVHEALQTAPGLLAVLNQATQTGQGRLRFFPAVSAAALIKVSRLGQVIADPGLPWSQLLWAPRGAMSRLPANLTMVLLGLLLPPALWLAGGW